MRGELNRPLNGTKSSSAPSMQTVRFLSFRKYRGTPGILPCKRRGQLAMSVALMGNYRYQLAHGDGKCVQELDANVEVLLLLPLATAGGLQRRGVGVALKEGEPQVRLLHGPDHASWHEHAS